MKTFFLDTSVQAALALPKDQYHQHARSVMEKLRKEQVLLITSDYVFDELLTLLTVRGDKRLSIEYSKKFPAGAVMLVFVTQQDFYEAKNLFERYTDKNWSFTDCVSFTLMKRLGIKDALSFDRDFTQAGFNLLK